MPPVRGRGPPAEFWPLLRDTMFETKCIGGQVLRREHLSIGQYLTLNWIRESGDLRLSHLADGLGISRPAATELVSLLESRGWVQRVRSTVDRRGVVVRLAPRAAPLFDQVDREIERTVRRAATVLSATERRSTARGLSAILAGMREQRERDGRALEGHGT